MSTFRQGQAKAAEGEDAGKPRRTVVLPPTAWAETWRERPKVDVCIGLRTISSADLVTGKAQAEAQAQKWYPRKDWPNLTPEAVAVAVETANDAYNEAVMRHMVARGTCDPNDVNKPYFKHAEDNVRDWMTTDAVRRVWDELLVLQAISSVAILRASPEDVERTARILADGRAMSALQPGDHIEVRTLLGYVLTLLVGTGLAHEKDIERADDGYNVKSAPKKVA